MVVANPEPWLGMLGNSTFSTGIGSILRRFFLEVDGMTGSYIINHDHTCLAGSQVATPGVAGDSPLGSEAFGEVMEARLFF